MINPYQNVNWETVNKVQSCSHEHCENQSQFTTLMQSSGLYHVCVSNYYPSEPLYLIPYTSDNQFIASPNAEHHTLSIKNISKGRLHINGLGSFFESGSPRGESPVGCNYANVSDIIPKIIDVLQYDDGGGVTINHPFWSGLTAKDIIDILDVDNRVLGLEIFNSYKEHYTDNVLDESMVGNIALWDSVLSTGRRCWGFCVADHQGQITPTWEGRNILLVNEITEHNCLKAYRNGEFYGKLGTTNLFFDNISFDNGELTVEAENADRIDIVIDGVLTTYNSQSTTVRIPSNSTYVRAEAHTDYDSVFSNPIVLKPYKKAEKSILNQILLFN